MRAPWTAPPTAIPPPADAGSPAPAAAPPAGLPTYALYGEAGHHLAVDWLHCESIAERSRRHDWEIRPHRHLALLQLLVMRRGRGRALLEGAEAPLAGPCVVTVAPGSVHGFRFEPSVDGVVITVSEPHARALVAGEPALATAVFAQQVLRPRGEAARAVAAAAAALQAEFHGSARWRALAIDAALLALLLAVARVAGSASTGAPAARAASRADAASPAQAHVARYRGLVEARFREQPGVAALAAELGITPTQLNRVCRAVLGTPAQAVLHSRLVLEAQRELAYTSMSIREIAQGLGFVDAAYFTRFFKRETGLAPGAWRARAAEKGARGRPQNG